MNSKQTGDCINCGHRFKVRDLIHWYGAHDVGPFCEKCDRLIKVHTRFREVEAVQTLFEPVTFKHQTEG